MGCTKEDQWMFSKPRGHLAQKQLQAVLMYLQAVLMYQAQRGTKHLDTTVPGAPGYPAHRGTRHTCRDLKSPFNTAAVTHRRPAKGSSSLLQRAKCDDECGLWLSEYEREKGDGCYNCITRANLVGPVSTRANFVRNPIRAVPTQLLSDRISQ